MGNVLLGPFQHSNHPVSESITRLGDEILSEKERREAIFRSQRDHFRRLIRRGGNPPLPAKTGFERMSRRELAVSQFPEAQKGVQFNPDRNRMAQLYIGKDQRFDLPHPAFGIGLSFIDSKGSKSTNHGRNGLRGWYSDQITQAIASARNMYGEERYKGAQRTKDHYAQVEARLKRVKEDSQAPTLFRLRNYNPQLDDSLGWVYRPGFSVNIFMTDEIELGIASRGATELQGYMSVMGFEIPILVDSDPQPLLEIIRKVESRLFDPAEKKEELKGNLSRRRSQ